MYTGRSCLAATLCRIRFPSSGNLGSGVNGTQLSGRLGVAFGDFRVFPLLLREGETTIFRRGLVRY